MAARAPFNYETADITRHIQDLVLNSTALPGFLENLAVFCADELSRFSGDVSCGITVLRPSGAPLRVARTNAAEALRILRPATVKGRK